MTKGLSQPRQSKLAEATPSNQRCVLVVDDEAEVSETTALMLEERSLDTIWKSSARDGLECLKERSGQINCVVSDYQMPQKDGLELLDAMREVSPHLPFILFTARGSERIASEAIDAGVSGYIRKGGQEQYDRLANRVEEAIEKKRTEEALEMRRKQFETIFKHAFDGIFLLDMDDAVIVDANPRACEVLNYPYEDLIGTKIAEIHPEDYEEYISIGRDLIEQEERKRVESLCYPRSGDAIPSDITAAPMQYGGKTFLVTIMRPKKSD